jgi:hypothetical protein
MRMGVAGGEFECRTKRIANRETKQTSASPIDELRGQKQLHLSLSKLRRFSGWPTGTVDQVACQSLLAGFLVGSAMQRRQHLPYGEEGKASNREVHE